jgi:hypothetical protein
MDELVAILLSVQERMEALITQIEAGTPELTEPDYLQALRSQRDDLDKAIALARNPQRKVY